MENTFILTLELFKDRLLKRGYKSRYINDIFIEFILKLGQLYIEKFHHISDHKWLTLAQQFISNPSEPTSKRPRLLGIINLPIKLVTSSLLVILIKINSFANISFWISWSTCSHRPFNKIMGSYIKRSNTFVEI